MKKQSIITALFFGFIASSFAQDKPEKPLTIMKFYPLGLVTNSLQLGFEKFNSSKTRSFNVIFGVRYEKDETGTQLDGMGNTYQNYSNWIGASVLVERRIYIPKLKTKYVDENPDRHFKNGVYLSPFVKVDFNERDFDNSFYTFRVVNGQSINEFVRYKGKIDYLGGTAGVNIGYQFTLFQHLYIDTYLGGGLRLLSKNENIQRQQQQIGYYYNGDNGAILEFVDKAGVVPNAGITVGVNW